MLYAFSALWAFGFVFGTFGFVFGAFGFVFGGLEASWGDFGPILSRLVGQDEANVSPRCSSRTLILGYQSSTFCRSHAVLCHLFHTPCARQAGGGGFLQENEGPEGSSGGFWGHF